jgi:hypothetical protein
MGHGFHGYVTNNQRVYKFECSYMTQVNHVGTNRTPSPISPYMAGINHQNMGGHSVNRFFFVKWLHPLPQIWLCWVVTIFVSLTLPSGKQTVCNWKLPFSSLIYHQKWWFSIVMWLFTRGYCKIKVLWTPDRSPCGPKWPGGLDSLVLCGLRGVDFPEGSSGKMMFSTSVNLLLEYTLW